MRIKLLIIFFLVFLFENGQSQLIQGTIKKGPGTNDIEVWLKPDFNNNNVQYLFQIGLPIAFPATASPLPTGLNVVLDPTFTTNFGNNYTVTVNPVASNTAGTEKYFNIVLVRGGAGASNPQTWTAGAEFKVLTATFVPTGSPATQVKLADYQDGGSDGQGNFYTQWGSVYFVTSNSIGNFYASLGQSTVGGNASAGYAQTISTVPVLCASPTAPVVSNITASTADINWGSVSGALGYEYAVTTSVIPPASGTSTASMSYNATSLLPGTLYYVHVRTSCSAGIFSGWVSSSFTTLCPAPTAPVVNNITATTADISWSAIGGVSSYEYAVTNSAVPPASGIATTNNFYNATGLTTGTQYYIHVRTSCSAGIFSSWSSTGFITLCTTPNTATITNITSSSADINWNAIAGVGGYEYAVTTSAVPPASGTFTATTSYSVSGLTTGTQYYFHLRSKCSAGNFSGWVSTPFITLCGAPLTPVVSNITTTTADINWNTVTGVSGYEYAVTTSVVPPASGIATTNTFYNATGLLSATQYYIHVRSVCNAGNFSGWVTTGFITQTASCNAPTAPVINNITVNSSDINWGTVPGVTGYEYAVTTSITPPVSGTSTTGTSYSANGLLPGTIYYVYIRSNCGSGFFSSWVSSSFATLCPGPAAAIVSNITSSTADINWTSVAGVPGYEYAINNSATPPVVGTAIANNFYNATGLTTGTQYYFHLRSSCSAGNFSAWVSTPFITLCAVPAAAIINNITASSADISWNGVSGAAGYEYAVTTSVTPPTSGTATGSTNYNATGLTTGTQYYVHVRSSCSAGNFSGWVTTPFITDCATPFAATISNITTTTADATWSAVTGVAGYEYAVTTNITPPVAGTFTTNNFYNANSLTTGTQYYFHLRSKCNAGNFSTWITTPFIMLCTIPTAPVVSNITGTTADINWPAVSGVSGYEYEVTTNATPPVSGIATTNNFYNASALTTGTQYYVHVRSSCSAGNFSGWVTTAFATVCPATTVPIVSNITVTGVTLDWTIVPGAFAYQYAITTSSTAPPNGTTTFFTTAIENSLIPGTHYYVYVRTMCSIGVFSAWTNTEFNTPYPPCIAPALIQVTNINTIADINWPAVIVSSGYEIAVTTDSVAPASGMAVLGTNYQASGLSSSTLYYVHVRNNCGGGGFSQWIRTSFMTGCFKPNPYVIANSAVTGTADLGWNSVYRAINYEYAILSTAASPSGSLTSTSDTVLSVRGLQPGAQYYLHIRTHCGPTSISDWAILEFHTSGIEVFPNPTSNIIMVSVYGLNLNEDMHIYDAMGRLMKSAKLTANMMTIDISNFAAGIYFFHYGKKNKFVTRVLKY